MPYDGFHPDLQPSGPTIGNRVHLIRSSELDADTAQSENMQRFAAITGRAVGSEKLWMGETHVEPRTVSANHHHGEAETAIFVRSGHPDFVFRDGEHEVRISTSPGDYVFIPPYLPHREENPSPGEPAVVVVARSTQEPIVVNLPELYPL